MNNFLSSETLKIINRDISIKYNIVPQNENKDSIVFWSISDDQNTSVYLKVLTGKNIIFKICSEGELILHRKNIYRADDKSTILKELSELEDDVTFEKTSDNDITDSPIVRLLNSLLDYGIEHNCSDIHIDSKKEGSTIRTRVDGVLNYIDEIPLKSTQMLISRIKVLSNLDYTIKNIPQDGRFTYEHLNKSIDIRVATTPTSFGEKIVLRILNKETVEYTKEGIGLKGENLNTINSLIHQPNGLLLICGPTGSGKTSTIYTLLKSIKSEEINIMTIEDPVEYKIEGINQIEINEKVGLNFESGLKSILRLDPDIIMVGEIRNLETADTAIKASISGRLVFSTIHANDSPASIYRLLDMGIDNYLLSAGVIGIVSQRLLRKLCSCKKKVKKYVELYGREMEIYEPVGCEKCYNGYRGRVAVFEILVINEELKRAINRGVSLSDLRKLAEKSGMIPLKLAMEDILARGDTSLEEIYKNIMTIGEK